MLRGAQASGEEATDEVPFDLKTDRYLEYDIADPGQALGRLKQALTESDHPERPDSPVFQLLPELQPQDPVRFLVAPRDFRDAVKRRSRDARVADLSLMSFEIDHFNPDWARLGQRIVAQALFDVRAFEAAAQAWQHVKQYDAYDVTANFRLATCYAKCGDLSRSDEALERLAERNELSRTDMAEMRSLKGSNAKTRWIEEWRKLPSEQDIRQAALKSPHLEAAFDAYKSAFQIDLNHHYSGINALATCAVWRQLADQLPEVWLDQHESAKAAHDARADLDASFDAISAAVEMAIRAERDGKSDKDKPWVDFSLAELEFLRGKPAGYVEKLFRNALSNANQQMCDSTLRQIGIYQDLGIFVETASNIAALINERMPDSSRNGEHQKPVISPAIASMLTTVQSRDSRTCLKRSILPAH